MKGADPVGGEIVAAENSPGAPHAALDGGGDPAPIEATGTFARDEPQGPGEGASVETIGLGFPPSAGEAPVRHEDSERLFAEIRPRHAIQHPETVGKSEIHAGIGRFDGWSQHSLQSEPPVVRLCFAEPRDRARHRGVRAAR